MYYLQSRYYAPTVGRFINADEIYLLSIDNTIIENNIFTYCKDTPVNAVDPNGHASIGYVAPPAEWVPLMASVVPAIVAAKAGLVASIKSVLAFLWNVYVVVGLILLVLILIAAITALAAKVMQVVSKAMTKQEDIRKIGYVVYVLARKEKDINSVFYVGRTKKYGARMTAHKRDRSKGKFISYVVVPCNDLFASKAIEQAVLSACIVSNIITLDTKRIGTGSNKIRGIAKEKVRGFKDNLNDLSSLMTCTADSDLLDLMGY